MSRETFELQYKDVAERTAKRLGTSPTTLLAQWGLETGWGKSIVPGTNNLGNIKDFSGKGVSAVDNATGSNDRYKQFATVDEFSDAYASLIERRYPKAVGQTTATGFATALKAGGYAEDEQYVSKIAALAGETAPVPSAKPNLATLRDNQERTLRKVFDASLMPASNPVSREAGLQRENQRTREDIADDPTGLEMAGAALAGNTTNSIFNSLFRPRFEAEPGYVPDFTKAPQGADSDLLHRIAGSKSAGETQQAIQAYEDEQLRMQTLVSQGTAIGVLGALGGEIVDPINWVAPFAAAKGLAAVGKGSEVLMAAGRTGAGYASAVGENLLSGTAIEAVKQSLQGEFKPVDLGVSLVADALIGMGSGALTARHASNLLTNKAVDAALIREVALAERAAAKLGPDATVQELQEAMKAEAKADLNARITDSVAAVPAERRLIDEQPAWQRPAWPKQEVADEFGTNYPDTVAPAVPRGSDRAAPDTPEFREWFGNSQVVQETGQPRIVYHGTLADIEAFDKGALGTNTGAASAKEGFFFSGHPATAEAYPQGREGANLVPVYLSMQNPLVHDAGGVAKRTFKFADLVRQAKREGRDGVIIKNTYDGGPQDDILVIFDEVQAKSAIGNSGAYSPTDKRLQHSATETGGAVKTEADFDSAEKLASREAEFAPGGVHEHTISTNTGGMLRDLAGLQALPAGVHLGPNIKLAQMPGVDTVQRLARKFLGDGTLTIEAGDIPMANGRFANAEIVQVTDKIAMIRVNKDLSPGEAVRALIHEVGHAIFNKHISKVAPADRVRLKAAFDRFIEQTQAKVPDGNDARGMRYSLTNGSLYPEKELTTPLKTGYELDWDEFSAEQFVKFLEADVVGPNQFGLTKGVVHILKTAIQAALDFLKGVKRKVHGVTPEYKEFFNRLANEPTFGPAMPGAVGTAPLSQLAVPAKPVAVVNEIMTDPDAVRFGLSQAPVGTAAERKAVQAMIALHKKAEAWEKANPMDEKWVARAQNLADNNVFNVSSIGLTMLKSPSPLVRMLASELVEDASGVAGKRHNTAAISKYLLERQMTGNAINDVQGAYDLWKVTQPGGGLKDDLLGGRVWHSWNQTLAAEIEARRLTKAPVNPDANVKAAVDSIEAAYQRIADAQRKVNTLGSEGLPESSVGYMPHRMSPAAVMRLTNEQLQVVHSELVDQFITIEGWDASFSDQLAATYLQRVRSRAAGDYGSNVGGAAAASIVEEALRKMDLPEDTIKAHMAKFNKGAAGYTKGRIELDLNRVHTTPDGDFRLLDVFETDQIELLRSQAGAASGDVALTQHGVRGKPGAQLLRQAMQYGENGKRAGMKEFEAFDQMMAEFRNEPFGTHSGKWLDRAMQANTLVRLGGIAFNQLAETLNGIAHIGAIRAAESVASIPRLRGEILALAKGQKVDNPIIGSIELAGGAEFGTDAYKFVMPFDSPNHAFPTYGQDTLTVTDRLLRGGGHLQAKLSGWRAIHSAQQRGMAEQIVHKMMRYVKDGSDDVALEQFGINAQVRAALLKDMNAVTKWNGDRLVEFDVTKIADANIREQVIQAVWRGTSQIIQGTYIGERGKWAHDGLLKLMTQFRTFSITSMEKQWGRQRNSRGAYSAFGLLVGSMAMATPIYMARVYANSVGQPDQEQYINDRLEPQAIARATLNYVASAGMASDFIDMTSSVLPESWGIKPTGGRSGVESDFVGNYIAPASSLVNDIWKYAQSPLELDDAAKIMPMRNVPYLVPLMNLTKD